MVSLRTQQKVEAHNVLFDPLGPPSANVESLPTAGNAVDFDMQDLMWSNLPWDWNITDDYLSEGVNNDAGQGWTSVPQQGEERANGEPIIGTAGWPVV